MFFGKKGKRKKKTLFDGAQQFAAVHYEGVFVLRMQDKTIRECIEQELVECIEEMFNAPPEKQEFLVLQAPQPQEGIAYVQACTVDDWIEVEIGVEKEDGILLLYKMCSKQECSHMFLSFYQYPINPKGFTIDITEFVPVPF